MKKKLKKLFLKKKIHLQYLKFAKADNFRLSIYKSNKHIYAQLINDKESKTLTSCSTIDKNMKKSLKVGKVKENAFLVGKELASRALYKGIITARFERKKNKYIGRVSSLIEGLRKVGIKI